jgi:hypothetical protein
MQNKNGEILTSIPPKNYSLKLSQLSTTNIAIEFLNIICKLHFDHIMGFSTTLHLELAYPSLKD